MYLLVADDLTGGNDAGIQFASRGLNARIALSPDSAAGLEDALAAVSAGSDAAGLLVLNTNSRNLPGEEAAKSVSDVAAALKAAKGFVRPEMVFKKIDSTLRGNLGLETDALMAGFGFGTAFLTPAYPGQGRMVRDGKLFVNGVPVHEAGFAEDPLTPIRKPGVADILKGQTTRRMGHVPLAAVNGGEEAIFARVGDMAAKGVELFLFDAENQAQLAAIAAAGMRMKTRPLFIGAAGLAEALADFVSGAQKGRCMAGAAPSVDRLLFICGSAHPVTRAQVAALTSSGLPAVRYAGGDKEGAVDALATALRSGDAILAFPPEGIPSDDGMAVDGVAFSRALGGIARDGLTRLGMPPCSLGVIMTGGETAYAVLRKICTGLVLERELLPGVALCSVADGEWSGLRVVTKAGGFGAPETMVEIKQLLRAGAPA